MNSGMCGVTSLKLKRVKVEEYNHRKMKGIELGLSEVELQNIKNLGMDLWSEFMWITDKEVILFLLKCVKDGSIVLDKPYLILKEAIEAIT